MNYRRMRVRHTPVRLAAGATLLATLLAVVASTATAQPRSTLIGLRAGYYTDMEEPFLGVELVTPVSSQVYFNPNVEYVFTDDRTTLTFNGDFHYDFSTRSPHYVWLGAGLGMFYLNPDGAQDAETDAALNLLFGAGVGGLSVIPYAQGKVMLADDSEFVLGFGLRF